MRPLERHEEKIGPGFPDPGLVGAVADLARGQAERGPDQGRAGVAAHGHGQLRGREFCRDHPVAAPDGDRHEARNLLQRDLVIPIAAAVAPTGDMDRAADGGVACEGYLCRGKEDAHLGRVGRVVGRLDEDGFRKVELTRDGLHLRGAEPVGLFDDGQGVARVGLGRENVRRGEGKAGHGNLGWGRSGHLVPICGQDASRSATGGARWHRLGGGQSGDRIRSGRPRQSRPRQSRSRGWRRRSARPCCRWYGHIRCAARWCR